MPISPTKPSTVSATGGGAGGVPGARVAAAAIAQKYLKEKLGIEILSYVAQVGDIKADVDMDDVQMTDIEGNIVRCPDQKAALEMIELIDSVRRDGDSIGGIIQGIIRNVPVGLGEPVFDKISADPRQGMLSINAV